MPKLLLVGHYGFANRGCEAIVRGTVGLLGRSLPGSRITLISRHADADRAVCEATGIPIERVVAAEHGYPKYSPGWFTRVLRRRLLNPGMTYYDFNHRHLYAEHDAVISIGGDNFSEDYGTPRIYFETLREAKKQGAVTVVWGASIGPFSKTDEGQWAEILRGADLITAREDLSLKYLESIGVAENVARVADPAFFMEPSRPQKLPPALERGEAVGLGVSGLLAERFGDTYLASTLALLKHLCARKDTAVVIVPHVIGRDRITDDTWVCQELVRRAGAGAQVASLDPGLNASEIKYCIARCGLFVGSRTHSTIASFSSGVPTLTIAYSTKGWGVGREMLGTDAYTLDVRKLTGASLIATFEALRGDAAKLREQLAKTVPVVKEQAQRGGDLLAKLVRAKSP